MRTYKKYSSARQAANGAPILQVGDLYIVGMQSHDEVVLIDSHSDQVTGHIRLVSLDYIGNGNEVMEQSSITASCY